MGIEDDVYTLVIEMNSFRCCAAAITGREIERPITTRYTHTADTGS